MKSSYQPNGCGLRISANRHPRAATCLSLLVGLGLAPAVMAQSGPAERLTHEPYQAMVTGSDLNVRCGPGQSYYPVGKFHPGTIVTVIGDDFGWARIRTDGRAFDSMFAWVPQDQLRLEADGHTGTALGRVYVLAPNATYNENPKSSWKPFAELQVEEQIEVLDQLEADGERYYKVKVPANGQVWVSAEFLRKATSSEVQAWQQQAGPSSADPAPTPDTQTPAAALADEPGPAESEPVAERSATASNAGDADPFTIPTDPDTAPAAEDAVDDHLIDSTPEASIDPAPPISMPDIQDLEKTKTLAAVTIDDLESSYGLLKRQPIREAEINGLRQRYIAVLESPDTYDRRALVIAQGRVKLLNARMDLQDQMFSLDRLRNRTSLSDEAVEAVRLSLDAATQYIAVGRIAASTIYDGQRLPRLLRLADPESGRTIAYIRTDADAPYDTTGMIGRTVGIVGDKNFDQSLRLNIITPKRVDVISSSRGG